MSKQKVEKDARRFKTKEVSKTENREGQQKGKKREAKNSFNIFFRNNVRPNIGLI